MSTAMILAAGLGTRLRPLTDELPKPMVPVGDAPIVVQIQRHLAAHGFEAAVMNTHHLANAFDEVVYPLPTELSHETEILGTAGGIRQVIERTGVRPSVVWNGDILGSIDLGELLDVHHRTDVDATWVIAPREGSAGNVGVDDEGFVVRVRSFKNGVEARSGDFLGIYALSDELMGSLPRAGCIVGDVLGPRLSTSQRRIATLTYEGRWFDIGTPVQYLQANLAWLEDRQLTSFFALESDRGRWPAHLSSVIVGAGASCDTSGPIERAVVWPGASVRGPLRDAIVTKRNVVQLR
ncbi:MAG: NDP-sugar synthase [Polyangiaceae bacterium]